MVLRAQSWIAGIAPEGYAACCEALALADRVLFDGRNLYDPDEVEAAGIAYYGIGRGRSLTRPGHE